MHYQTFLQKECTSLYFPWCQETAHFPTWLPMLGINSFWVFFFQSLSIYWMKLCLVFICIYLISNATYIYVCTIYLPFVTCDMPVLCPFLYFSKKCTGQYKGKNDITNIQIRTTKNKQAFTFYHFCFLVLILGNYYRFS